MQFVRLAASYIAYPSRSFKRSHQRSGARQVRQLGFVPCRGRTVAYGGLPLHANQVAKIPAIVGGAGDITGAALDARLLK
jgi:hypothetical protein